MTAAYSVCESPLPFTGRASLVLYFMPGRRRHYVLDLSVSDGPSVRPSVAKPMTMIL